MTPYEAFHNKKPKINHLIIFGSDAYPLELTNAREKFEPTAKPNCIMIGYSSKEGIYWIFDKTNKKVFRSRDVKFNEDSILNQKAEEFDLGSLIDRFKENDNNKNENKEEIEQARENYLIADDATEDNDYDESDELDENRNENVNESNQDKKEIIENQAPEKPEKQKNKNINKMSVHLIKKK
jgi:hypothetical protein